MLVRCSQILPACFFGHGAWVLILTQTRELRVPQVIDLCFTLHLFMGWAAMGHHRDTIRRTSDREGRNQEEAKVEMRRNPREMT